MVVGPREGAVRRPRTKSRRPAKTRHGSTTKTKRNNAPTAARPANSTFADLQQQVSALTLELSEALEQQTATSEVLRVISSSPGELEPVFAAMLENAVRICDANFGVVYRCEGDVMRSIAMHNMPPAFAALGKVSPFRPSPKHYFGPLMATKTVVHVADLAAEQGYIEGRRAYVTPVESGGVRTFVAVPMLKGNELIGVFNVGRQEVRPFTDKQIALLTNFASQAVIAIENVRLLNELRARTDELGRSVGELRALGEVGQAVNSTLDLQTVLSTIVAKAVQLSDTDAGSIYVHDETQQEFQLQANYRMSGDLIGPPKDHY